MELRCTRCRSFVERRALCLRCGKRPGNEEGAEAWERTHWVEVAGDEEYGRRCALLPLRVNLHCYAAPIWRRPKRPRRARIRPWMFSAAS